jgi:hypothetical protein
MEFYDPGSRPGPIRPILKFHRKSDNSYPFDWLLAGSWQTFS